MAIRVNAWLMQSLCYFVFLCVLFCWIIPKVHQQMKRTITEAKQTTKIQNYGSDNYSKRDGHPDA